MLFTIYCGIINDFNYFALLNAATLDLWRDLPRRNVEQTTEMP